MNDKARLIETAGLPYTSFIMSWKVIVNFFYGCLTPSTGYIQLFDLEPYMDGVRFAPYPEADRSDGIAACHQAG